MITLFIHGSYDNQLAAYIANYGKVIPIQNKTENYLSWNPVENDLLKTIATQLMKLLVVVLRVVG